MVDSWQFTLIKIASKIKNITYVCRIALFMEYINQDFFQDFGQGGVKTRHKGLLGGEVLSSRKQSTWMPRASKIRSIVQKNARGSVNLRPLRVKIMHVICINFKVLTNCEIYNLLGALNGNVGANDHSEFS